MPRGYRIVIVAAVGWLTLTAVSPPPAKTAQSDKAERQRDYAAELNRIAVALERYQPEREDKGCPTGEYDKESDLCAQWKAADAAQYSAWAAIASLGIGLFTLVFAWRAAHWAKEAASHTKSGVDTANAALHLAAQESRAWIAVKHMPGRILYQGGMLTFHFDVTIENVGKLVAKNVVAVHFIVNIAAMTPDQRKERALFRLSLVQKGGGQGFPLLPGQKQTLKTWDIKEPSDLTVGAESFGTTEADIIYPAVFSYIEYEIGDGEFGSTAFMSTYCRVPPDESLEDAKMLNQPTFMGIYIGTWEITEARHISFDITNGDAT